MKFSQYVLYIPQLMMIPGHLNSSHYLDRYKNKLNISRVLFTEHFLTNKKINRVLAHQTEIATLFAWVIKLHLTQVFSPRLSAPKNTQNLEINQIWGVGVQEKESNMGFCSRWKFPTLGMTVLSGTSAEPRFRSVRSSLGLETSI